MNTKPDDTTLALWLDDELEGEELALVETWAADLPEQLAAREEIRRWRKMLSATVPAAEEPPAPEFFNERILHCIREHSHNEQIAAAEKTIHGHWWMPAAACAGMALAFLLGMKTTPSSSPTTAVIPATHNSASHVYAPEQGVEAEFFTSSSANATVIVLSGVNAIPDSVDFSQTAASRQWREIDSTAVVDDPENTDL